MKLEARVKAKLRKPDVVAAVAPLVEAAELLKSGRGFDEQAFERVVGAMAALGIPDADLPGW